MKKESLDDIFEEQARIQGEEADARDADPAVAALRERKQREAKAQFEREVEQGIRDREGNLLVENDIPEDDEDE